MNYSDFLKQHLLEIGSSLKKDIFPFSLQLEQLSNIYGINITAFCAIIVEIDIDRKPFKTA